MRRSPAPLRNLGERVCGRDHLRIASRLGELVSWSELAPPRDLPPPSPPRSIVCASCVRPRLSFFGHALFSLGSFPARPLASLWGIGRVKKQQPPFCWCVSDWGEGANEKNRARRVQPWRWKTAAETFSNSGPPAGQTRDNLKPPWYTHCTSLVASSGVRTLGFG